MIIDEINDLLSSKCSVNNFHFIDQSNGWTSDNGILDFLLFYLDGLHLVQNGNLEFGKSILKAVIQLSLAQEFKVPTKMQCAPQISI